MQNPDVVNILCTGVSNVLSAQDLPPGHPPLQSHLYCLEDPVCPRHCSRPAGRARVQAFCTVITWTSRITPCKSHPVLWATVTTHPWADTHICLQLLPLHSTALLTLNLWLGAVLKQDIYHCFAEFSGLGVLLGSGLGSSFVSRWRCCIGKRLLEQQLRALQGCIPHCCIWSSRRLWQEPPAHSAHRQPFPGAFPGWHIPICNGFRVSL